MLQRVDVSRHINSEPKPKPELLNSLPTINPQMVTGVYRSNKTSKLADKPTTPSQKLPAKRKLDDEPVSRELSGKTLQEKTAKKLKQNSDQVPIIASKVTEEISVPEMTSEEATENVSKVGAEDMDVSDDDKSDDIPLATLKSKTSEEKSKQVEDIRRHSEDISEDDIPLATVKAKLEEKIKLVEDLSLDKSMTEKKNTPKECSKLSEPVEAEKSTEASESVELIPFSILQEPSPEKIPAKEKTVDVKPKTIALDCPSKDDVPLSETLLTKMKPVEYVQEAKKPDTKKTNTIPETMPDKQVAIKPVVTQPVVTKPVPDKSIADKAIADKAIADKPVEAKPEAMKLVSNASSAAKSVAIKSIAVKPVTTKSVEAKPVTARAIAVKPVASKSLAPKFHQASSNTVPVEPVETKPATSKSVTVKRVIVKSVVTKPVSARPDVAKLNSSETAVTTAENASKPIVPTSTKPLTNTSKPIESKPIQSRSTKIKPVETDRKVGPPVIDLTDPADDVKQEIDDPEFDAARVANRRKSLNEMIDLCSDTSSEPAKSPASSTSCKRYKDYDNIDEQLEADMEREQQYFDGVDEAHDRNLWNPLDEEQLPSSKFK